MIKKTFFLTLLFSLVNAAFVTSISESAVNLNADTKQESQVSGYFVTAGSVLNRLKENKETLIIDIRSGTDFGKASIPGSINIPLFAVKTKTFLKNKDIFLINQGYDCRELGDECSRLNKKGFKAFVIHGGLNSWIDAGGNIDGDAAAISSLNKVSPRDVYLQDNPESRLIINISSYDKNADSLIPGSVSIPLDSEKTFQMKLIENLNKNKDNKFLSTLIFNQNGEQYEKIEKIVQKTGTKNVFYLEGGLDSYIEFFNMKSLMSKRETIRSEEADQCCTSE